MGGPRALGESGRMLEPQGPYRPPGQRSGSQVPGPRMRMWLSILALLSFSLNRQASFTVDLGGTGGIEIENFITIFQKCLSLGAVLGKRRKDQRSVSILGFPFSSSQVREQADPEHGTPAPQQGGRLRAACAPCAQLCRPLPRSPAFSHACSASPRLPRPPNGLCSRNFPFLCSWQPQCQMASVPSPSPPPDQLPLSLL